jgi:hypothetical protein
VLAKASDLLLPPQVPDLDELVLGTGGEPLAARRSSNGLDTSHVGREDEDGLKNGNVRAGGVAALEAIEKLLVRAGHDLEGGGRGVVDKLLLILNVDLSLGRSGTGLALVLLALGLDRLGGRLVGLGLGSLGLGGGLLASLGSGGGLGLTLVGDLDGRLLGARGILAVRGGALGTLGGLGLGLFAHSCGYEWLLLKVDGYRTSLEGARRSSSNFSTWEMRCIYSHF